MRVAVGGLLLGALVAAPAAASEDDEYRFARSWEAAVEDPVQGSQWRDPIETTRWILAVGPDGSLYSVYGARGERGQFQVLSRRGGGRIPVQLATPTGMVVGADGTIHIIHDRRAWDSFSTEDGAFVRTISRWFERGDGEGMFNLLAGIAVASDGTVWLGDRRYGVQGFSPDGDFLIRWGRGVHPGDTVRDHRAPAVGILVGIATGPDDTIYVLNADALLQRFTPAGSVVAAWDLSDRISNPRALALGSDGRIFVADTSHVLVLDPNGEYLTTIGTPLRDSAFNRVDSVAVAHDGSVYVSDLLAVSEDGRQYVLRAQQFLGPAGIGAGRVDPDATATTTTTTTTVPEQTTTTATTTSVPEQTTTTAAGPTTTTAATTTTIVAGPATDDPGTTTVPTGDVTTTTAAPDDPPVIAGEAVNGGGVPTWMVATLVVLVLAMVGLSAFFAGQRSRAGPASTHSESPPPPPHD